MVLFCFLHFEYILKLTFCLIGQSITNSCAINSEIVMLGLHVRVICTEKKNCAKAVVSHAEKPHLSQRLETAALTLAPVPG